MIAKIKTLLLLIWDVCIPRFITEDVALRYIGPGPRDDWSSYEIACCMADVGPGKVFDGVASVDAFQFLSMGITYRVANFRPWRMHG